ncbi:proliferating cell nuclear antigen [Nematocida sp. AWRm77]|nr:proliferating cell nuclear antigen [Nematocida sp. AWRm77]
MFELKIGKGSINETESLREGKSGEESKCTTSFFRRVLEGMSELVKNMEMKASPEGISIQAMDTMNVSMVDIYFKSTAFESFRCDKEIVLVVPLAYLLKIFRSLPMDGSSMQLSAGDDAKILLITSEENGKKYSYKLNLLGSQGVEVYNMPEKEMSAKIILSSSEFQRVAKTLGAFGDILKIQTSSNSFLFAQESEMGDSTISFSVDESGENNKDAGFKIFIEKDMLVSIPYRFFSIFGKFVGPTGEVIIELEENKPIYMTSKVPFGSLNYYIAPRDSDDN